MRFIITRNDFVELLMRRDGITRRDAEEVMDECLEELRYCGGNYDEAEDIVRTYLGLEPDYLYDLIEMIM